jgi:Tol biopolymer transport system component/predicted Ser/Thr protein kinase
MIGETIGNYRITAKLGEGGMGEVYRATDTRLGREVAIKVAKEQFSERFEREAHAVAALNHPNICQLYDVGPNYLVMELVEGIPLKGPLPLEKAIEYAGQILDALDAAHKKGITHRDLKPANILVTKQGIKLLDFGLAKQTFPLKETDVTRALTEQGQILGTLQYMSPEQLQGKEVDARSDLFSFGCVLYEMLTGKRAFEGHSGASVIAAILEREPEPLEVARPLDRVVRRSLAKDPDQRFQTARDLKAALAWALEQSPQVNAPSQSRLVWVAVVLAIIGIAGWAGWWRVTRPVDRALMRLNVDLGPDAVAGQFTTTEISPDGARLVFPVKNPEGKQALATRLLSETKHVVLSGTENGRDPFFSPDGKWIGFFADRKMKKISVHGGAPVVLCDASPNPRGASWTEDGNIIAGLNTLGSLSRVPAEGGTPQPVTKLQAGALTHRWPQALPGGERVLFTVSSTIVSFEDASIAAVSLKTGEIKILVRGGYFGRYLPTGDTTGHLVYVHEGVLFGVPFDPTRLELRGTAVPLLEDLAADPNSGGGQFSFSESGTLAYRAGKTSAQGWPVWWLDSSGKTEPLISQPSFYTTPRFSPDGGRLALVQVSGNDREIFIYDSQRDTMSRLTFNAALPGYPVWSPDGKHIVFYFSSPGGYSLGWIRADGSGETQRLLDRKNLVSPVSFFSDGRRLAYHEADPDSSNDLWTLPLDVSDPDHPTPRKPELFLRTPSNERDPAVSPDGRWIAYKSDESGRNEVYVRPFPGPGGKAQISNTGGQLPIWSRNGRELFFQNRDNRIMVTDYKVLGDSFIPDKPHLWVDQKLHDIHGLLNYDLAPDGKRFAIFPEMKAPVEERGDLHVAFLLNFFDELRRRVPVNK